MSDGNKVYSKLEYGDFQRLRRFGFDVYETALTDEDKELLDRFDSKGSKTVQAAVSEMRGKDISALFGRLNEEQARIRARLEIIDDVGDQISRSIR